MADDDGGGPPDDGGGGAPAVPSTFGAYLVAKAGMEGVDLARVKRVVHEASKNSPYFAREARREAELGERLARLRMKAAQLTPAQLAAAQAAADAKTAALLAGRDVGRTWIVADMDQFFLACHARGDPSLLTRPVAVGAAEGGGVVSTASYAARAYGVRSAMPGFIALKLCPSLHFVAPDFELYAAAAADVRAVFAAFDPRFRAMGLDEAALDVTDWCAAQTPPADGLAAAAALRAAVRAATGLAVSCGVAPNRLLAKVAADAAKPDGAAAVPRDPAALAAHVAALPVRKVPGVGRVTEATLAALGVGTCGQLYAARGLVFCLFGPATADFLLAASLGCGGAAAVDPDADARGRRGLSAERTFGATADAGVLEARVKDLAARVAERAAAEGLCPRSVTLKIKYASFDVKTRAAPLPPAAGGGGGGPPTADAVATVALKLLRAEPAAPVRLLGVRLSSFDGGPGDRDPGQATLEDVLAPARAKRGGGDAGDTDAEDATEGGGGGGGGGGQSDGGGKRLRAHSPPPPGPPPPAPTTAVWECRVCTFAGTPSFSLRCGVCDAVRGSLDAPPAAAAAAGAPRPPSPKKKRGAGTTLTKFFKARNK